MRKYSVLTATISALLLALISTPAHASVENGNYVCTTGMLATTETTNVYKITSNVVTSYSVSIKCAGAVVIPEGVTSIGNSAFSNSPALTSITIPEGVTSIGAYAFTGATALTSITIPATVISIGDEAFYFNSALTTVAFADGSQLTSIGNYAFMYATKLTSITIPASVTNIGSGAFFIASALASVYFLGIAPIFGSDVFKDVAPGASAYVKNSAIGFEGIGLILVVTVPETVSNPEASAPAVATETVFESIRFSTGTKVLTNTDMSKLKKSVKTSGTDGTYVVTGTAGMLPGVTESQVKRLAELRANVVQAYLVKLGVDNSNISIKIEITNQGIVPMTKISGEHLVS